MLSSRMLTMLASIICPFPDFVLSSSAKTIPRAQVRPPPAKSANRFSGAEGFSPLRPSRDKRPVAQDVMRAPLMERKIIISAISWIRKVWGIEFRHCKTTGHSKDNVSTRLIYTFAALLSCTLHQGSESQVQERQNQKCFEVYFTWFVGLLHFFLKKVSWEIVLFVNLGLIVLVFLILANFVSHLPPTSHLLAFQLLARTVFFKSINYF